MKNTILNLLSAKLALVSFILAGLFLLAPSHVQAQTTTNLYGVPNVTYVSTQTAIERVETKILFLKGQYEILTHGTQAYDDNEMKYSFYSIILDRLNEGKTTKESLESGLTLFGTDQASTFSKTMMQTTRQEAINLLKQ